MSDIIRIHSQRCPINHCRELQLSWDGVQESKSSPITTDVFAVSFKDCHKVYPMRLIRPTNRNKYPEQDEIKRVIDDINKNACTITACVLDNPKRSNLRCALCHSATYACEYCEAAAVQVMKQNELLLLKKKFELRRKNIQNTIKFLTESPGTRKSKETDNLKIVELNETLIKLKEDEEKELKSVKKHLAWPFSTMTGRLRTKDLTKYVVSKITRSATAIDKHEAKGFKGQSHLLYQPNFDFIDGIPVEYMHSGCLGVIKRMVELTYNVGECRDKVSKRKLSDSEHFNRAMRDVQHPRECSRRSRNLDLGIIKAQEYRNMSLFFFPIIIESIEDTFPKEKMTWLYLTFILRACVIPNKEFNSIEKNHIKNAARKFYFLFEKCYGESNCTYSIHVIASHLLRIRGNEPLTERSAFIYESFYAEMKNLFHAGTTSPLKQILQNTMMKRILENHCCKKPITFSPKKDPKKGLENNYSIYIYNDQNKYDLYNIIEDNGDGTFKCTPQGRFVYKCQLTPEIDWSSVGVFKVGPSGSNVTTLHRKDIHGKVIKVKNFLITCPINILNEQ